MSDALDSLSDEARERLAKTDQPEWIEPMLATLTDDHFSDPGWVYERKLDGERCIGIYKNGRARLLSRNQKNLNDTYPELEEALRGLGPSNLIVDGEIVAFEGGVTSFSRLQQRMKIHDRREALASKVAVYFYLFDVLYLDGYDTTQLALRDRKRLLRDALEFSKRIRFTAHRNEHGEDYLDEACEKGWEGLIAKDANAPYVHTRSRKWLKFKCINRQEFVIGGFTEPGGERHGFGAIVVGFYDDGEFVCAGKVGTGFDDETLSELGEKMKSRERRTSPFDRGEPSSGEIHWIRPDLVAEIGFTEWTGEGRLRHPRYIGLRRDKQPKDVVREKTEPAK